MFIVTSDEQNFINLDRVVNLCMVKTNDAHWEIRAIYSGSYITLETFYSKIECKNIFEKIQSEIVNCKRFEKEVIYLGFLWE